MPTDQMARLAAVADQALNALDRTRPPGHTEQVLGELLDRRSNGFASSGGMMVLNADPDGGPVPRTTDVYVRIAGPIDPVVDAGLRDRTHRAMAAVGLPVDPGRAEQTLRDLLRRDSAGSASTGGLLVKHGVGRDGCPSADVYVHVGGWDEFGQFHIADGTFESPWPHVDDPEED